MLKGQWSFLFFWSNVKSVFNSLMSILILRGNMEKKNINIVPFAYVLAE